MYTNGILVNEENLRALKKAGLDELRFNLGATNCSSACLKTWRLLRAYCRMWASKRR